MTLQASTYSTYRAVDHNLPRQITAMLRKRRFDMAGGVWREVPRKRPRLRRLALLLVTTAALAWFVSNRNDVQIPVSLAQVETRDVPVYLDTNATVQANQTVTVHAQMDGQLTDILFREGQDVKAGDVLARLDPRTYQTQYDEAVANQTQDEAMLAKAKNALAKIAPAKGKHADPKETARMLEEKRSEVRQFEASLKSDQVTIDTLKTQLSRSVIVSPIDGRTGIRQVDAGNLVHASDTNGLVVITQIEPVTVVFNLPEKSLRPISDRLSKNETIAVLAMDSDNRRVLDEGTLQMVDNQIDAMSGQIRLKASFPNHKRVLWPGASVRLRMTVSSLKGAVVVPLAAVHYPESKQGEDVKPGAKPWVFVYKSGGHKVEMRPVKLAMTQDGDAVIEEGVYAGEKVVTDSLGMLADGSHVMTRDMGAAAQ